MWSRKNLKENAKVAFKRNYWKCVFVAFILGITMGSGSAGSTVGQSAETIISDELPDDISTT